MRGRIDLLAVCGAETRVLEVGARDPWLARFLRAHGRTRYLGVAAAGRPAPDGETWGDLLPRLLPPRAGDAVPANSAEVIVLAGAAGRHLWSFRGLGAAGHVAWSPAPGWSAVVGVLGLARHALTGRVRMRGVARAEGAGGRARRYLLAAVRPPARATARRHLSPVVGVAGFFRRLDERGVRYCVLRWFETLPAIEAGEDIDLLVEDGAVEEVERILAEEPGTIPVDVYSASGLPGTTYREMAYYPPALARMLLERAERTGAGILAPSPEDHFHSLAYHAVYHKGERSGIPARAGAPAWNGVPEHDYAGTLERLARACGVEVELTLEALDAHLARAGWRPPDDMLVRLAAANAWLRRHVAAAVPDTLEEWRGLAVFFLRERAIELGLEAEAVRRIEAEGFHVLRRRRLGPAAAAAVRAGVRGGNWERGPWPASGGGPAEAIVAFDLLPIEPRAEQRGRWPTLDNARVLVKAGIRDALNAGLPPAQRCNMLHSSDNHVEALRYLEAALPDEVGALRAEIAALRERFRTREPVRRTLTRYGRRAKVEVIEYRGGLAVKKTFRPGCERFLEREVTALRTFGGTVPEVPPLLEAGDGYVVYPYYADAEDPGPHGLLPLDAVRRVLSAVRTFYEHGYSVVDFKPSNLVLDRRSGPKIVDFEFLHRYAERPPSFEACYELAGLPEGFEGDRPDWGGTARGGYAALWEPRVGLDLASLLHDPPWLQRLKQWQYRVLHVPVRRLRAREARVRTRLRLHV